MIKQSKNEYYIPSHYTGASIFPKENQYKYLSPLESVAKMGKQDIKSCPLCGDNHYIMVGKFEIDELINQWVSTYGFNPISDAFRHEILEKRYCSNCGLYFYNFRLSDSTDLYELLANHCDYYPNFRWEYGAASSFILKNSPNSLIEIGSGNGSFLERIRGAVPMVIGSEYNKEGAKTCLSKGLNVSSQDVSLIKDKFDMVCSFEVLEHVTNTAEFMENMIKLLNPKGMVLFGTPDPEGILRVNGVGHLNLPPHHQYDFSYKSFVFLAEKYNLKIVDYVKSELNYHWYERYAQNVTHKILEKPDISGFFEAQKQYTGHSHFVAFEKL